MRRSSATLLADTGVNLTTLKRHGGWKSDAVAEGYIEESVGNKVKISKRIATGHDTSGGLAEYVQVNSSDSSQKDS